MSFAILTCFRRGMRGPLLAAAPSPRSKARLKCRRTPPWLRYGPAVVQSMRCTQDWKERDRRGNRRISKDPVMERWQILMVDAKA